MSLKEFWKREWLVFVFSALIVGVILYFDGVFVLSRAYTVIGSMVMGYITIFFVSFFIGPPLERFLGRVRDRFKAKIKE